MPTNSTAMWNYAIALDGGTTNTRGRLVRGGQIIATARRSIGVRDNLPPATCEPPESTIDLVTGARIGRTRLAEVVRELLDDLLRTTVQSGASANMGRPVQPDYIVAAGMLSSDAGLVVVPHVEAPAGPDDVARRISIHHIPTISDRLIYFVPGLRTPASEGRDGWFMADVMRGEECETWGAYAALRQTEQVKPGEWQAFLWPGSHTKLVEVDGAGRIVRSHTSLAGEFLQVVADHTLVAASLPRTLPDEVDCDAAEAGARAALRDGLGRAAFLIRIADLTQSLNAFERASFWIGAVVANDVEGLAQHSILAPGRPVWVGGREPLRSLFATWLGRRHQGAVAALNGELADSASALGALDIVSRRVVFDRA